MPAPAALVDVSLPISTATTVRARAAKTKHSTDGPRPDYVFRWNRCDRKGQRCRVICRGKMNSALVEFDDGWRMVTSRNALRRAI